MGTYEYELNLESKPNELLNHLLDFEYYPNFMKQIKEINIIEKSDSHITTEEILIFKSIFSKEIRQTTSHTVLENGVDSVITDGLAKGTHIHIILSESDNITKVKIKIDLKLDLKSRIFEPLFKKFIKMYVTGVLRKINNKINSNVI